MITLQKCTTERLLVKVITQSDLIQNLVSDLV